MKNVILTLSVAVLMTACINSSTAWTNRSISYQVTPEQIGEHSAVTGSPTSNDSAVNADKLLENTSKINAGQAVNDSSSNDQSKKQDKDKEAEKQPVEDTPLTK